MALKVALRMPCVLTNPLNQVYPGRACGATVCQDPLRWPPGCAVQILCPFYARVAHAHYQVHGGPPPPTCTPSPTAHATPTSSNPPPPPLLPTLKVPVTGAQPLPSAPRRGKAAASPHLLPAPSKSGPLRWETGTAGTQVGFGGRLQPAPVVVGLSEWGVLLGCPGSQGARLGQGGGGD